MSNLIKLNGKDISASEYYYGCPFNTWDNMLYKDAIQDRKKRVKEQYFEALTLENKTYEEQVRLKKLENALKDCEQICDERLELLG